MNGINFAHYNIYLSNQNVNMVTQSIAQTLGSVRSMLDASAENLQRLDDPNARRLDATMKSSPVGLTAIRTEVVFSRNINLLQEKAYIGQITVLESKNIYTEFLSAVQSVIGGGDNQQQSQLVTVVDEFFQSAKSLDSNSGPSMRKTFINKAEKVSTTLSGASDKVTDLRLEADKRLGSETVNINNTIRSLFTLNNEMLRSALPVRLHDQRDTFVRDLSKHFDIKVSYGRSGVVQVTSKSSGELLVSSEAYSQFTYNGVLSKDRIIDNEDLPELTIKQFDKAGNSRRTTIFAGGSGDSTRLFSGGTWSALMGLRDKTLPEIGGAIKTLASNFTKQVNDAHNNGSPFPPKGSFKSAMDVSGTQSLEGFEAFTVYAVDKEGGQLRGGAGRLNPVTIDMQKLLNGTPTISDLLAELNEHLDLAPSRERAAMGAILGAGNALNPGGIQIPGEYLLNNIQLKANSIVDAGNGDSFTFELDLQGNSHFGSKIEVLSVRTADDVAGMNVQNVAANNLPGEFSLGKDQNVATGQSITVTGAGKINPGAGDDIVNRRVITVKVRITGENGVVSTGFVSFRANAAVGLNDRIAFDSSLARGEADDFNSEAVTSHSGVAKARLVDAHGNTVDPASGQTGRLVIESNNPDYRLVFQGGNIGAQFGFNNLFKYDARTGDLEVEPAIVGDVNQLAIAQVQKNTGEDLVHSVGDVQASGEFEFIFGLGDLIVDDTVTVDGVIFTFANVPVGNHQVGIGDTNILSLTALKDKINIHPAFNNRIAVEFDGANIFTVKALIPGISGNDIEVEVDLAGGVTVDNDGEVLSGGANKSRTDKVFSYNLEPGSKQVSKLLSNLQASLVSIDGEGIVPDALASLSGLATIITGLLSDYLNEAVIDSKVAATVLKQTDKLIKENSGIQRESEYLRALDLAQLMNALSHLLSMIQSSAVKTQDIIFGH